MLSIFPSEDNSQYKAIVFINILSILFAGWLAAYAFSNYKISINAEARKKGGTLRLSTLGDEAEVIIIPHLHCIGQLAVATGLYSVSLIFYSIPSWENAFYCYFINGVSAYARNASCLWSFTIVCVLYYIIRDRKWRSTTKEKKTFLNFIIKVNWLLPLLPTIIYLVIWTVYIDPQAKFVQTDDSMGFEQNCLFLYTFGNGSDDDDNLYYIIPLIADSIQLAIPTITSLVGIVMLCLAWTRSYHKEDRVGKTLCLTLSGYPTLNFIIVILSLSQYAIASIRFSSTVWLVIFYICAAQGVLEVLFFVMANYKVLFFTRGLGSCFFFCSKPNRESNNIEADPIKPEKKIRKKKKKYDQWDMDKRLIDNVL